MTTIQELQHIVVVDTETSGVDVENDRIVTAFIGLMDRSGELTYRASWLLNPGIEIPAEAAAVHGVTTERAQTEGGEWDAGIYGITQTLRQYLEYGLPLVAYNARYDFTILDRNCRTIGIDPLDDPKPVFDPFITDKAMDKYRKGSRKLLPTAAHYGITLENAHTADADAIAAGRLMLKLLDRMPPTTELEAIHNTTKMRAAEQAREFQAYLRRTKDPSAVIEPAWPVVPFQMEEVAA